MKIKIRFLTSLLSILSSFVTVLFLSFLLFPAILHAEDSPADQGLIPDPYMEQSFLDLYRHNKLIIPDSLKKANVLVMSSYDALLFKGGKGALSSDRITISDSFLFEAGKAGRITVDGLGDRGLLVYLEIYLDDEATPLARIPLDNQMGKNGWQRDGSRTVNILEENVTGQHRVSIRIVDESDKPDDARISVLLRSIEFAESSLPVLYFNIDERLGTISAMNNDEYHGAECYGNVTIQIPDEYVCEYAEHLPQKQTLVLEYIRGRGNSTWSADKKPYKMKLDKKTNLFGMGRSKHWILLANRYDNSHMRNKMTNWLGEQLGLPYTPQSVPVEVVMNGEYYGLYDLSEQVRIEDSRVAIDDLEGSRAETEPEISGGYLLSMDSDNGNDAFSTGQEMDFLIESPAFEDGRNEAQTEYIKNYVQKTEDAVFGKDFTDDSGISYREYMDISSAVDYYWIQAFSLNGDAFVSGSTYLYKTRSGPLYWGPLWDFDYVAWGNLEYKNYSVDQFPYFTPWHKRLFYDPAFSAMVIDRWPYLRSQLEEVIRDGGLLDRYYDQLSTAMRYDLEKWGSYVEENPDEDEETSLSTARSYSDEVNQLRKWILARIKWVDKNLDSIRPATYKITFKAGSKTVKTKTVAEEEIIGSLPKAPAKKGYVFAGWYYQGERIYKDYCFYSNATVKAKYVQKKKAKKAKKIYLTYDRQMADLSDYEYQMGYTVMPKNAYNADINWTSSNRNIATVDSSGLITLKKAGTVTIKASISKGPSAKCVLTIVSDEDDMDYCEEFRFTKKSYRLKKGGYTQIKLKATPKNCIMPPLAWISTNPKVVSVDDNGVISGLKKGSATIIAIDIQELNVQKVKVKVKGKARGKKAKK